MTSCANTHERSWFAIANGKRCQETSGRLWIKNVYQKAEGGARAPYAPPSVRPCISYPSSLSRARTIGLSSATQEKQSTLRKKCCSVARCLEGEGYHWYDFLSFPARWTANDDNRQRLWVWLECVFTQEMNWFMCKKHTAILGSDLSLSRPAR